MSDDAAGWRTNCSVVLTARGKLAVPLRYSTHSGNLKKARSKRRVLPLSAPPASHAGANLQPACSKDSAALSLSPASLTCLRIWRLLFSSGARPRAIGKRHVFQHCQCPWIYFKIQTILSTGSSSIFSVGKSKRKKYSHHLLSSARALFSNHKHKAGLTTFLVLAGHPRHRTHRFSIFDY